MGQICTNSRKISDMSLHKLDILVVGFDGAGKTTFVNSLYSNNFLAANNPTNGLRYYRIPSKSTNNIVIDLVEIGGGRYIRDIWSYFFLEAMGIVYMIDLGDVNRFELNRKEIHKLLLSPLVRSKPVLFLFNKSDTVNVEYDIIDVYNFFHLTEIVNSVKIKCNYFEISCKYDTVIELRNHFNWLVNEILSNYEMVNNLIRFNKSIRTILPTSNNKHKRQNLNKKCIVWSISKNLEQSRPVTAP